MIYSKFDKKLIFVIGSGRSGTHLLGRTFENSKEIDAFIEDKEFFYPITEMAVGLKTKPGSFQKLLKKYKRRFRNSKKDYILEKTHPNIWFVEELLDFFPQAKFIGIKRDVFATVSSMLRHDGVLKWYKKLPQDQPNKFLGIDENNKATFKELPLESKCTLRWISHTNRLEYLEKKFPDSVKVVDYEAFYDDYDQLMQSIESFLNLDFKLTSEVLNAEGKNKWQHHLNPIQIANIKDTLTNFNLD